MLKAAIGHVRGNAVAYVALFLALSGTAVAAKLVTGADIQDPEPTDADADTLGAVDLDGHVDRALVRMLQFGAHFARRVSYRSTLSACSGGRSRPASPAHRCWPPSSSKRRPPPRRRR